MKVGRTQEVHRWVGVGVSGNDLIKLLVCGFFRNLPSSLRLFRNTGEFLILMLQKFKWYFGLGELLLRVMRRFGIEKARNSF
jgi:hypothetical protein